MSKWLKPKKKEPVVREVTLIQQDYANTASQVGDAHFKIELEKAKLNQLTMRLAALRDEHEKAMAHVKSTQAPAQESQQPEATT